MNKVVLYKFEVYDYDYDLRLDLLVIHRTDPCTSHSVIRSVQWNS